MVQLSSSRSCSQVHPLSTLPKQAEGPLLIRTPPRWRRAVLQVKVAKPCWVESTKQYFLVGLQPTAPSCNSGKKASFNGGLRDTDWPKRAPCDSVGLWYVQSFIKAHQAALLWLIKSFANAFPFPKAKGQLYHFFPLKLWAGENSILQTSAWKEHNSIYLEETPWEASLDEGWYPKAEVLENFTPNPPETIIILKAFSLAHFFRLIM